MKDHLYHVFFCVDIYLEDGQIIVYENAFIFNGSICDVRTQYHKVIEDFMTQHHEQKKYQTKTNCFNVVEVHEDGLQQMLLHRQNSETCGCEKHPNESGGDNEPRN